MAFVNEYISKEDEKKFIASLDLFRKMEGFPSPPYNWTRDAERGLWLTRLCMQRPGMGGGYHAEWLLYDKGRYYEFGSCLAQGKIPEHFEDHFIDVLFPVIKAKFALFQMEIEGMFTHSSETSQASFGIGPKALNAVDV